MAKEWKHGNDDFRIGADGKINMKAKGHSTYVPCHHLAPGDKVKNVTQKDGKTLLETLTGGIFEMMSSTSYIKRK